MKNARKLIMLIAVFAITVLIGCSSKEQISTMDKKDVAGASNKGKKLNISPQESTIEWTGKKVTGQHNGTIELKRGDLFLDNGKITGGNFEIDFTTIKNLDIEDTASNGKLTGHLKSNDFFSADTHPLGKFDITSITPISDGSGNNFNIVGNLNIKGITKEITIPAKVDIMPDKVVASSDFNIDRTLWDIKYGSGKFFENLGDKMINDDFNIKLNIVAK